MLSSTVILVEFGSLSGVKEGSRVANGVLLGAAGYPLHEAGCVSEVVLLEGYAGVSTLSGTDRGSALVEVGVTEPAVEMVASEGFLLTRFPPLREPPRTQSCCSRMHRSQGGLPGSPLP